METEQQKNEAKEMYKTMCDALDEIGWNYEKDEKTLNVTMGVDCETVSINLMSFVDEESSTICTLSILPFSVPSSRVIDVIVVIGMINCTLIDGRFTFTTGGNITYSTCMGYKNSFISKEAVEYLVYVSCAALDAYSDMLMAVAEDRMSIMEAAEALKNR